MIHDSELGRYECIDPSRNHKKFWHIVHDVERNIYMATWGRIGQGSPAPVEYTEAVARRKINEKLKKGYIKNNNPRYERVRGSLAVAFILSLEQDGDGETAA